MQIPKKKWKENRDKEMYELHSSVFHIVCQSQNSTIRVQWDNRLHIDLMYSCNFFYFFSSINLIKGIHETSKCTITLSDETVIVNDLEK
jgi:hypothetical protein